LLDRHPFVMGVNGSYLLRNAFHSYFAANSGFVEKNAARIAAVETERFFVRWNTLPACRAAGIEEERLILFEGPLDGISASVSTDLTGNLPLGPTVLLTIALPALVWCGFQEILLIGADFPRHGYGRFHTGQQDAPRQARKPLISYEREMEIGRFRAGLWAEHLRRHHPRVRVLNCSPPSELDAFEKAELASVVR
jgi:hypothetical protein